jgi:hypothetical protein
VNAHGERARRANRDLKAWLARRSPVVSGARERMPAPLIKRRLPSGAGAMLQPNVTGDGDARLTPRFWVMVVITGVATGLLGDLMMFILFSVEHLAFGVDDNGSGFTAAVARAGGWHRVLPLLIGGVIGGVAWYLLRRFTPGQKSEVDEVLWTGDGRLSVLRSFGTSVISEVVIGLGASLGREAAPKLMGRSPAASRPDGRGLPPLSGACWSPAAAVPGWRRSTTCRSAERCSPPRSSSAR